MSRIIEWTKEQQEEWDKWVASRPRIIQEMCKRFPPYNLYLLKSSGHKVTLHSYSEDGTMTVNVSGEYNAVMFERQVFGIKPDGLTECDIPSVSAPAGTILTENEDVESFILANRN